MIPTEPAGMPGRIARERHRLGLTQAQVAKRLGVARASYAQIENATTNPHYDTLVALVTVVGMDPAALMPEIQGAGRPRRPS